MKLRTFFSGLAVVAGVLLLVGLLGFWGLTAQNPQALLTRGGPSAPSAAQFVPRQSPLMVSLLTRPDRLWGLRQLRSAPQYRSQSRQTWQAFKSWVSATSGLDYDQDLRPWLGDEVTFAVTSADLDHVAANGQQPGYLLVLTSRQGLQARESAHLFWQQQVIAGEELIFEPIAGTTLIYNRLSNEAKGPTNAAHRRQFASTVVGDRYVLLANDPQVVRQAIAAFQAPDISLAQDPLYQGLVKQLPPGRIAWSYSNLDKTLDWLGLNTHGQTWQTSQLAQKVFLSWRLTSEGISADTALVAAPGSEFTPYLAALNQPVAAMDWLPSESVFAAGSNNLNTLWQTFSEGIGRYELVQSAIQPMVTALSLGTNGDAHTVPELWTRGEGDYAVGLLPGQLPAWVFVAKSSTAITAEPERLDQQAQQYGFGVAQVKLEDHWVTAWTRLSVASKGLGSLPQIKTDVVAVHTQIDAYDVFATSLEALQRVLERSQHRGTGDRQNFQAVLKTSEYPNAGLLYLDWPQITPLLEQQWPWVKVLEEISQPLTAHIRAIVLSPHGGDRSIRRGELTFVLME
ncbi:MAG: DUF3352 domain-containing protein [Cyanobacteria bacterium]|nr:DUF3352 domain-containing protein [Cyanobacteriota bacterium]MDA0866095.1 DUF3352 domain-containing protein [Cyanobacteriota bacterium]